jgi:hypothetical protein
MSFPLGALEQNETRLIFALLLRDRITFSTHLLGDVSVTAGGASASARTAAGPFCFSTCRTVRSISPSAAAGTHPTTCRPTLP